MQLYGDHEEHIGGLVQDSSNSNALAVKLLQSCTKPLIYFCFLKTLQQTKRERNIGTCNDTQDHMNAKHYGIFTQLHLL